MPKVVEKTKVKKASKQEGSTKKSKTKSSKVSNSWLLEVFAPQIVKIDGTVVARDAAGIVLAHRRRASSKLMHTRLTMKEIVSMPSSTGEEGTLVLCTSRRYLAKPMQYKGTASFSAEGVTVKTVAGGTIFLPDNKGYRIEITAEEE